MSREKNDPEKDTPTEEKREFVRTCIDTKATVKKVRPEDVLQKKSLKTAISANIVKMCRQEFKPESGKNDIFLINLAEYLMQIDEKLDFLIQKLSDDKDVEAIRVIETRNISGSGVWLVLNRSLSVGEYLYISLVLPDFPLSRFEAYGEVARVNEHVENGQKQYEVGINFVNLTEDEREILIAYAFCQERKQIRQSKGEES